MCCPKIKCVCVIVFDHVKQHNFQPVWWWLLCRWQLSTVGCDTPMNGEVNVSLNAAFSLHDATHLDDTLSWNHFIQLSIVQEKLSPEQIQKSSRWWKEVPTHQRPSNSGGAIWILSWLWISGPAAKISAGTHSGSLLACRHLRVASLWMTLAEVSSSGQSEHPSLKMDSKWVVT